MQKIKATFIITAILISLVSFNCSQSMDCSKVKNGKFFYYSKIDRRKISIERVDSLQIESDLKNNMILRSKIIWQTDCKFQMFVNAFSEPKLTKEDSLTATKAATIEIVGVTAQFYICILKFSSSKKDYELRDTMYFQK